MTPPEDDRNDIERRVRIEEKIVSLDRQVQSLRDTRHEHGNWLQKLNLQTADSNGKLDSLAEEVRHMDGTLASLQNQIAQIDKSSEIAKVRISFIIAGIGFGSGIVGAIITAIILARVLG